MLHTMFRRVNNLLILLRFTACLANNDKWQAFVLLATTFLIQGI